MVVGLVSRFGEELGGRVVSTLGSSAGRAAVAGLGAGAAGGMLLDDIPWAGPKLDPTESNNNKNNQQGGNPFSALGINPNIAIIGVVVLLLLFYQSGR